MNKFSLVLAGHCTTICAPVGAHCSTFTYFITHIPRIAVEYYINDRWSIRSGLFYDALGAEDYFGNVDKINYLNLPLNANWHFGKDRNWYLNFGPAIGFLLSAKTDLINGSTIEFKDEVKNIDIGLAVGIGYKFEVTDNVMIAVDIQNYNGFIHVLNDSSFSIFKNARTAINTGVVFEL